MNWFLAPPEKDYLFHLNIPVLTIVKLAQADREEEMKAEDVVVSYRILTHLGISDVRKLEKGMNITGGSQLGDCLASASSFPEPFMCTTVPGELIHER